MVICHNVFIQNNIMILYGGRAAESILFGGLENISLGASHDIKEATRLAMAYVNSADGIDYSLLGEQGANIIASNTKSELDILWDKCLNLIKENWGIVKLIAEELKVKETISGDEFLRSISED